MKKRPRRWLMKSEPDVFSVDDLQKERCECWEGVRNYQARNMMRDDMKKGDVAFFYHSNCNEPGIVGIMTIDREAYPDPTQFDARSKYFDPKSDPGNPRWLMVDVRYKRKLRRSIGLAELKRHSQLRDLALVKRGNRLSVMPVTEKQWNFIVGLE